MTNNQAVKQVTKDQDQSDLLRRAQEKGADGLSLVAERIHERSDAAKEYLDEKVTTAEELVDKKSRAFAESSRQKLRAVNTLGHRAAGFIDDSSESLRNADIKKTKEEMIRRLRKRPEIGILGAGAFGLVVGYIIGKRH